MTHQSVWNEYGEKLECRIRLKTFPLAVKFLKNKEGIPKEEQRPQIYFGHRLILFQAFQLARRKGVTVIMLAEDMWCHESMISYGLLKPPVYFQGTYQVILGWRYFGGRRLLRL